MKAKLRQHEQRTSNEVRTQFVPFGARTANGGKDKGERAEFSMKKSVRLSLAPLSIDFAAQFYHKQLYRKHLHKT